ncbi:MAG: nucleoside deaminase [Rhizobiaceae bacterium]|nr:nucleoside deaminase [Rhizobiaceae bacterium]
MIINQPDTALLDALLETIEKEIIPKTKDGVKRGSKIFGAALLRKSDYSVVVAETNNEIDNPLWHGEVHALKRLYEIPIETRPDTKELIFLSTHEPCSMCLSAIAWSGFDNFYYFFSHEDSRDSFSIPHDLRILKEIFTLDPGGYRRTNAFWESHEIQSMIEAAASPHRERLQHRAESIAQSYGALSSLYQRGKAMSSIPLK